MSAYGNPGSWVSAGTPFFAQAGTVDIVSNGSSQSVELAASANEQVQVYNGGSTVAFVAFGNSAAAAVAVVPSGSTPGSYPVAPGAVIVCTVPLGTTYAASIGGTGSVYFTPGLGN